MRPVNLIPQEQRRAHGGASRTGPLAYVVVAGLVALLAGVVVLVLSSNQISESESELAALNARQASAQARADRLAPYASFQEVEQQRTSTIYELANSRFDWPRVLRQLSLVIPKYVVLGKLTGLTGQGVKEAEGEGSGSGLATEIKSPSLSLSGCAVNQKRVAALIVALHQIDGVTRVGLDSAKSPDADAGAGGGDSSAGEACRAVKFSIAVAFDAAPSSPDTSIEAEASAAAVEAPAESSETEGSGAATTTKTGEDGSTTTTTSKTTTVTPPSN